MCEAISFSREAKEKTPRKMDKCKAVLEALAKLDPKTVDLEVMATLIENSRALVDKTVVDLSFLSCIALMTMLLDQLILWRKLHQDSMDLGESMYSAAYTHQVAINKCMSAATRCLVKENQELCQEIEEKQANA